MTQFAVVAVAAVWVILLGGTVAMGWWEYRQDQLWLDREHYSENASEDEGEDTQPMEMIW